MFKRIKEITNFIEKIRPEIYIASVVIIFYFALWIINPGKYLIIASYAGLAVLIYAKLKDFHLSLLVLNIASSIISSGKSYYIQIVAPGVFDKEIFPHGYSLQFTINIIDLLAIVLLLVMVRDWVNRKVKLKFSKLDFFIVAYFIWRFLSNTFGSIYPQISLLFYVASMPTLVMYFFVRSYAIKMDKLLPLILALFCSFVVFQSVISLQQYSSKSPIGKNLELQHGIEYIGNVDDELSLQYSYRPDGTFDHANTLGMNLAFWITFIFVYYIKTKYKILPYIIGLGVIALVVSLSRSAWVGLALGMIGITYLFEKVKGIRMPTPSPKLLVLGLILLSPLVVIFILPRIANSGYSFLANEGGGTLRLEQISAASQVIMLYPVFGVGENMFIPKTLEILPQSIFRNVALDIHNWYISLIANHGVPAFLFLISFVLLSAKSVFIRIRKKGTLLLDFINIWYIGATIIFLTIGMFAVASGDYFIILFSALLNNEKDFKLS